ncbi:hypothetical protein SUDANB95_07948 (plasmid) [Actinosynnema sp. ALI-1.44]
MPHGKSSIGIPASDNGLTFNPLTVAHLRENIDNADGHVQVQVELPDGTTQTAYGLSTNRLTHDRFVVVLAHTTTAEDRHSNAPIAAATEPPVLDPAT